MKHLFFALLCGALCLACDDGDDGSGDGGSSGGSQAAANCGDRCIAKANSCPEIGGQGVAICDSYCGGEPSESNLSCIEGKSCADIIAGNTDDCDDPEDSNGGSNGQLSCDCNNDGETDVSGVISCNGRDVETCQEACACLAGAGALPGG